MESIINYFDFIHKYNLLFSIIFGVICADMLIRNFCGFSFIISIVAFINNLLKKIKERKESRS